MRWKSAKIRKEQEQEQEQEQERGRMGEILLMHMHIPTMDERVSGRTG